MRALLRLLIPHKSGQSDATKFWPTLASTELRVSIFLKALTLGLLHQHELHLGSNSSEPDAESDILWLYQWFTHLRVASQATDRAQTYRGNFSFTAACKDGLFTSSQVPLEE